MAWVCAGWVTIPWEGEEQRLTVGHADSSLGECGV